MSRFADNGALPTWEMSWPANGRQAIAPTRQANVVTCNAEACRSAGFCATTPHAYATAAARHSRTPRTDAAPLPDMDTPTTAAPANEQISPASTRGGSRPFRSHPPSSAIRIGPTFTSIDAVPASTFCSPQFSVTKYTPNQRTPAMMMPRHAARGGPPCRRDSEVTPRASRPTTRRPRASGPAEKCEPALRMTTNADAHSRTVTAAERRTRRASRERSSVSPVISVPSRGPEPLPLLELLLLLPRERPVRRLG